MNPTAPSVSIVTPVHNGSPYLEELIASVRRQDYPGLEHIIIDDGSDDDGKTVAILQRYDHLRWWSRENRGQYATMNEGLRAASGDFVCFVSADDVLLPGAVDQALQCLNQCPIHDGVIGMTSFMEENGSPYPIAYPFRTAHPRYYAYFSQISHCSMFVNRRRILDLNLYFDDSLHYVGDYDWILRVLAQLSFCRTRAYLARVRIHEAQTSTRYRLAMEAEKRRVMSAHHIDPFRYWLFTRVYVAVHDWRKLRQAWISGGSSGAWQLVADHFRTKERSHP